MARPLRLKYPGAVYHLTSRGNRQENIYRADADRLAFLEILGKTVKRYNWICYAYCLMDNHYHLLVETPDGNLSSGMRQLNGMFTQHANRVHNSVGHVFQGRYKSILVEKNAHLLELCRYIVLNPVRAKTCDHPLKWRWSSYSATATGKFSENEKFLTVDWILKQFAGRKPAARQRYAEFVLDGCLNQSSPWEQLRAQIVYGSDVFLDGLPVVS